LLFKKKNKTKPESVQTTGFGSVILEQKPILVWLGLSSVQFFQFQAYKTEQNRLFF
jgi:hypothetical protein